MNGGLQTRGRDSLFTAGDISSPGSDGKTRPAGNGDTNLPIRAVHRLIKRLVGDGVLTANLARDVQRGGADLLRMSRKVRDAQGERHARRSFENGEDRGNGNHTEERRNGDNRARACFCPFLCRAARPRPRRTGMSAERCGCRVVASLPSPGAPRAGRLDRGRMAAERQQARVKFYALARPGRRHLETGIGKLGADFRGDLVGGPAQRGVTRTSSAGAGWSLCGCDRLSRAAGCGASLPDPVPESPEVATSPRTIVPNAPHSTERDSCCSKSNGPPLSTRVLFVRFVAGAEEVPRRKPGHLLSYVGADPGRVSVMHSAVDPGVEDLRQRV